MDIFGGVMCVSYATGRYPNRIAAVLGGKHLQKFYKLLNVNLRLYY